MKIKNEDDIIEAFQILILSIASIMFMTSITMLIDMIYKYL